MMIRALCLFLLSCVLLVGSCKKRDNVTLQLPPLTNTGSDVMGFKMNGDVRVISGDQSHSASHTIGVGYLYFNDGRMQINAHNQDPNYEIYINFLYNDSLGTYVIDPTYPYGVTFSDYTNGTVPTGGNQYTTDATHGGTITISYRQGYILSGTFACDVVNSVGVVAHITEGRFDITGN